MKSPRFLLLVFVTWIGVWVGNVTGAESTPLKGNVLGIHGTRFTLNDQPFPYTGISFFNAIYNPTFNQDPATRRQWLAKFQQYGINVLRIWCQWDNKRTFVDLGPDKTLYQADGQLRPEHLRTLKASGREGNGRARGALRA
jgi:hypothetical protein